jgi:hypothetical protein
MNSLSAARQRANTLQRIAPIRIYARQVNEARGHFLPHTGVSACGDGINIPRGIVSQG